MPSRCWTTFRLLLFFVGLMIVAGPTAALAQEPEERQPLDMMLVIDNSCSMFPASQIVPGCQIWGNDPDFLRLTGASLFIARLGFAEPNADDYQAGVVSLGEAPPDLISPLQPLPAIRDSLARAISAPEPALATQIVPALQLAYEQLQSSEQRRLGNQPAIVLLTDGAPFPATGQSDAEVESLVASHPDIPLFMILLQNPEQPVEGYDRYITFWEEMQRKQQHVRTYRAGSPREIERTYNEIVSILQNTVSTDGITLTPGQTLNVYVSKYVQRLILTVMHERGRPKGKVEIEDPSGRLVQDGDAEVVRFRGNDNPVEVISIGQARLDQAPRDDVWTVTSDAPVVVFLDRAGAYDIEFLAPEVSATDLTNQYLALDRHSPTQSLLVHLRLLDKAKQPLLDAQPIRGRIVSPDGSTATLPISSNLQPNTQGVYEIPVDFASAYPTVLQTAGRFMLMFEAGLADEGGGTRLPIARADLLVDVGRGPYIANISPDPIVCVAGQPVNLTATIGDLDTARIETVHLRVFGAGREANLSPGGGDVYVGALDPLCKAALSTLGCDATQDTTFRIRLVAELQDGTVAPPTEYTVPVKAQQVACTPTSTPIPTATPTPTPTPIPDTDVDGLIDPDDECPLKAQWSPPFDRFGGCPPKSWLIALLGLAALGLLLLLVLYLVPALLVRTILPPPTGFVLVCKDGQAQGTPKSIHEAGIGARRRQVTIGSDGHIRVSGVKPVELIVARRGGKTVVLDGKTKVQRFELRAIPHRETIRDTDIVLLFGTEGPQLKC